MASSSKSSKKTPTTPTKLQHDPSATGYVVDISPVKQSRDGKRKYFDFKLQGQGMEQRAVCFSPEKFKLLSTISKESAGCEVKKFKRGNCNEILINDFSSVRKIDVLFDKTNIPKTFTNIAKINNECGMYEIVNLKAYLYNLALEESASKFGKPIKFRQASLKDSTDSIAVTVFGDLADKLTNNTTYSFTNLRISKYMSQRLLKSTDTTQITISEAIDTLVTDEFADSITSSAKGRIVSVNLKSMDDQLLCIKCKNHVVADDNIILCEICGNMSSATECVTSSNLSFTFQKDDGSKLECVVERSIAEECFQNKIDNHVQFARLMINSNINLMINSIDNTVTSMKLQTDGTETQSDQDQEE